MYNLRALKICSQYLKNWYPRMGGGFAQLHLGFGMGMMCQPSELNIIKLRKEKKDSILGNFKKFYYKFIN